MNRETLRCYLVADPALCAGDLTTTVRSALRGGVTMVQLRAKQVSDREFLRLAREIRSVCDEFDSPFIVNDRLDIALAADADGIHLGVNDLPVADARRVAGAGFLIGYSPESDNDLHRARARGADYLGIGPVFGTSSKSDAGAALGIDEFQRRMVLGGLPTVGIGGVTAGSAREVFAAGADGVAVVSAILQSPDPEAAARALLNPAV